MKKLLSTLTAVALLLPQLAMADNQYTLGDVYDLPVMYLGRGLSSGAQTNNIFTVPVIRNNEEVTPPAMSGAVFELSRGGLTEKVFATRVTVNTSTNVLTLTGTVIRDLCFTAAREFATCGNGVTWQKGTEVRLVTHARQLNSFVNKDRANVLTASGGLTFTGSGSLGFPTFATEAERNRSLGSTPSGPVRVGCVTATGKCEYYIGGAWIGFGSGGTVNASTTTRGAVQLATVANLSGGTITGSTGAPLVVGTDLVIRRSTGAINNRNKIVATNNAGRISGSLLPPLTPSMWNGGLNASALTFSRGDGTWATTGPRVLYCAGSGSNVIASSTSETDFNKTLTLTGGTLGTGGTIRLHAYGVTRNGAGSLNPKFRIYIGASLVATLSGASINLASTSFELNSSISLRKYQTTGQVMVNSTLLHPQPTGSTFNQGVKADRTSLTSFNIVSNPVLKVSGQMGNADPANTMQIDQFCVEYLPPG